MKNLKLLALLAVVLLTQFACSMKDLPRNMPLTAFNPHRESFTCQHEATVVPPIDPEAEQWLQQGLALTSQMLWPNQRDYGKAVQLWQQAADRKHWKAMLNLASLYAHGEGVPTDTERAVQIVESAMQLGIPGAFDMMGTFHMEGLGVKQDASRAYAFWQLAADMGSASAQAYLGSKMDAVYNDPPSFWANRKVALKMLECGVAQGNGKAAFALGITIKGMRPELNEDNARALFVLHEGVKFGNAECAAYLGSSFRHGEPLVNNFKDVARGDRYFVLSEALERDPDLRLPNLDKVLPLPPARLPFWDSQEESLVNAAKAVVPAPPAPPKPAASPASQRTGRAHIPEGFMLPEHPQLDVPAQYETTRAPESGYWLARLKYPSQERHLAWDAAQLPMRYTQGELFDRSRPGLRDEDGRIRFHYLGELVPVPPAPEPQEHPLVARAIARYGDLPQPPEVCRGHRPCPHTGVWSARVPDDHPLALVFNQWHRQAYVEKGQPFPDPQSLHLDIEPRAVTWQWWAQANDKRDSDVWTWISVDAPRMQVLTAQADAGVAGPSSIT